MERAIDLRIAGGNNSTDTTPHALAYGVENIQRAHNAHTQSLATPNQHFSNGPVPYETQLALSQTNTFPGQPSVFKPGS